MQIQADFDAPALACRRVFGDGFKKVGTDAQVLERESNDLLNPYHAPTTIETWPSRD